VFGEAEVAGKDRLVEGKPTRDDRDSRDSRDSSLLSLRSL
jgi:hypothetical protein